MDSLNMARLKIDNMFMLKSYRVTTKHEMRILGRQWEKLEIMLHKYEVEMSLS